MMGGTTPVRSALHWILDRCDSRQHDERAAVPNETHLDSPAGDPFDDARHSRGAQPPPTMMQSTDANSCAQRAA